MLRSLDSEETLSSYISYGNATLLVVIVQFSVLDSRSTAL